MGLAQIWVSGDHITKGLAKVNDSYFNTSTYNTPAWKNLVMCQEVGHTLGLDHQDEAFDNPNLGTCMDYTSDPDGPPSNEHPNAHDYEQLETIYAHLDSFTTVNQTSKFSFWQPRGSQAFLEGIFENPSDWGKKIRETARIALYERDFGAGMKLLTFIIKAE
ncbi:MAG: hypothetical protein ACD_36C00073G0005 [uncultured bacterium]|nr:MAG: hypothetical protein ACD_36C00073G0005 [uncultured bacterium]